MLAITEYIEIKAPTVSDNKTVTFMIACSGKVNKFFSEKSLVFNYDIDINTVDQSVLYIPAVASMIGLAWATGADIYVESLDEKYIEALESIKLVMKRWYPQLACTTKIVTKPVSNNYPVNKWGLLFSGGLDSVTSYIKHRKKDLVLITISGKGKCVPCYQGNYEQNCFLPENRQNVFIKTNVDDVINVPLFNKKFGLYWWMNLSHGIVLTSYCAPVTYLEGIGTLLISSSFTSESNKRWGSHPEIDNKICWANTRVVHDNFELTRQEKIRFLLKNYIKETGNSPQLVVCGKYYLLGSNCMKCEKCNRTIVGLLLEGVDPHKCGFDIDDKILKSVKDALVNSNFVKRTAFIEGEKEVLKREFAVARWKRIQNAIPDTIEHDMYGSKEFFEWFKNFDMMESATKPNRSSMPHLFLDFISDSVEPLNHVFPVKLKEIAKQVRHKFPN